MTGKPTDSQAACALLFDRGSLIVRGSPANRPTPHFVWDFRAECWRAAAWRYAEIVPALGDQPGSNDVDRVLGPTALDWPTIRLNALRDDQREALDLWSAAGCRGLVVMPTGTGKTEVALAAMARCSVATLVVAPVRDLMYQWQRRIEQGLGCAAGILGDGQHEIRPVTVTTYDSAFIYMEQIGNRFGLVVFDEVHHLAGPQLRQAAELCAAPRRLGLTATLERADGRQNVLLVVVGPVVYRQEVSQARGRSLAEYETIRIPVHLTPREQVRYDQASAAIRRFMAARRQGQPGYSWQDACRDAARDAEARRVLREFRAKTAIEDRAEEKLRVLEDLFRLHAHEAVLVFAGSNAMALEISRRFLIPVLLHCSRGDERREALQGLAEGRLRAVVANQVLDEGIDVPDVKVAVVVGGQASTRQAKQRLGRILRKSGASRAVLYEIVCTETREQQRSKQRRKSDAYAKMRRMHR
jgi:superfamily II DNA or RNA helicase